MASAICECVLVVVVVGVNFIMYNAAKGGGCGGGVVVMVVVGVNFIMVVVVVVVVVVVMGVNFIMYNAAKCPSPPLKSSPKLSRIQYFTQRAVCNMGNN